MFIEVSTCRSIVYINHCYILIRVYSQQVKTAEQEAGHVCMLKYINLFHYVFEMAGGIVQSVNRIL